MPSTGRSLSTAVYNCYGAAITTATATDLLRMKPSTSITIINHWDGCLLVSWLWLGLAVVLLDMDILFFGGYKYLCDLAKKLVADAASWDCVACVNNNYL
jgi:hypothetical protein